MTTLIRDWEGLFLRDHLTSPLDNLRTIIAQHDRIAELQATIDRLMLEHCPSEMTPEQIKEWENATSPIKIILD